jgi:hypothetical protein
MDTFFNPTAQSISLSSFHFSVYLRSNISVNKIDIGAETSNKSAFLFPLYSGNITYSRLGDFYAIGVPFSNTDSRGFWQVIRLSPTNTKTYKNDIKKNDGTAPLTALPNQKIVIGALNSDGTIIEFSPRQNAFASIGDGLLDTQASAFYSVVQSFQVALNRAV